MLRGFSRAIIIPPSFPLLRQSLHLQRRLSGSVSISSSAVTMSPERSFQLVVAYTISPDLGIGFDGTLPWSLPSDLSFFKRLTSFTLSPSKRNALLMGRRTWDSIPPKFRPLPGRLNVVLTRSSSIPPSPDLLVFSSLQSALRTLASPPYDSSVETVFVIGGGQIFKEALSLPGCVAIHATEIDYTCKCDTFFPKFDKRLFRLWYASSPMVDNNIRYSFTTYVRDGAGDIRNEDSSLLADHSHYYITQLPKSIRESHEEYQYLNLIQDIIQTGADKGDRTGTGTLSKFGCQMRFNLRRTFPLLTTKKVFWRGVLEELLWFISGSTNAKVLQEKGIHIWDGNASRDYLDSIGLSEREEGDLGPIYGFQWRHFGAKYTNMHANYSGQGFDQLADIIDKLKHKQEDRRIILSAWNPADLQLMALPPCHMFAQFYVVNGELSCQMYQRSCDMGLGVPFNIASYALLTCILAHVCELKRGELIHVLGDAHVYKNHIEPLKQQLQNTPKPFPALKINAQIKDIDMLCANDFELVDYNPHKKINMKMAV